MTGPRKTTDLAAHWLLATILIAGVAYALVTPPFEVPDEPAHFFRAAATAELRFFTTVERGERGQWVPAWAYATATGLVREIPWHPDHKLPFADIIAAIRHPADGRGEIFIPVGPPKPNALGYAAAGYTPLPYIVPATVIAAGRSCGIAPVLIVYLCRLANLALATLLLTAAIRIAPAGRWLLAVFALTPMAVAMTASLSADGLTIGLSYLFLALVLRELSAAGPIPASRALAITAVAMLICLTKPSVPLFFAVLGIPLARLGGRARRLRLALLFTVSIVCALAFGSLWARDAAAQTERAALAGTQIAQLLHHPFDFVVSLVRTYIEYSPRWWIELIGKLGWFDAFLPGVTILLGYLVLLIVAFADAPALSPRLRTLFVLLGFASAVLIAVTQFVTWTPAGDPLIEGIQGRYFLPAAAPLVFLALRNKRLGIELSPPLRAGVIVAQSLVLLSGLATLIERFYL